MGRTVIIPDIHGNLDVATTILRELEVLNDEYDRVDFETTTVQLGDLLNGVGSSITDDNRCLDHVEKFFDVWLCGNHDHPYLGGTPFGGFWKDPVLTHRVNLMYSTGFLKVAHAVDDILITHAGLNNDMARYYGLDHISVTEIAEKLNYLWQHDKTHALFNTVGSRRGGWQEFGGVLWSDWHEYKSRHFKQIVGHSVAPEVRIQIDGRQHPLIGVGDSIPIKVEWEALCLDLGAGKHSKVAACAVVEDGDVTVEFIDL